MVTSEPDCSFEKIVLSLLLPFQLKDYYSITWKHDCCNLLHLTMTEPTMTTIASESLTSTTAPGKMFESRAEIAMHYKSDWHKYNLKRREAGLALLKEEDFRMRLETALALRKEREGREERTGKDHLKNKQKERQRKQQQHGGSKLGGGATAVSQAAAYCQMKSAVGARTEEEAKLAEYSTTDETTGNSIEEQVEQEIEDDPPDINPYQCLFDKHVSSTIDANVERMHRKYGFFIPDQEYLIDKEGLVGYCHEKIKLGHICLCCHKTFTTWQGCQKHMISTRHTKLRYEHGFDLEEFDPFYDFTEADAEFLAKYNKNDIAKTTDMEIVEEKGDDDEEWEDVSDDEEMVEKHEVEDDGLYDSLYDGYQEEIAKYGFDVTPLGELILPDGRIIGHRTLSRYYKQHFRPNMDDPAVAAARRAAGERLYRGRVYQTGPEEVKHENSLVLLRAGITPGTAQGRSGAGVLVKAAKGGYSALSLYRYKAVVAKTMREEARSQRLVEKTKLPMNKMDKKANRLFNGVSVAHAKR